MPLPIIIAGGILVGATAERYGINLNPIPKSLPDNTAQIDSQALTKAKVLITLREGKRTIVYTDTRGRVTLGIGHLVTDPELSKYPLGSFVPDPDIQSFFRTDIQKSFDAARDQARDLGKYTVDMIAVLTSVNFQLGTGWKSTFANTWSLLKSGDSARAIRNLNNSAWAQQTPIRVSDFVLTIKNQYA